MTDSNKYTPAPWYIAGEDEPVPGVPAIEIMYGECPSPECTSICYVNSELDENEDFVITEKTKANARLIAAAPELLEALKEAAEIIQKHTYPCPDKPNTPWSRAEDFKNVIKKATGGKS